MEKKLEPPRRKLSSIVDTVAPDLRGPVDGGPLPTTPNTASTVPPPAPKWQAPPKEYRAPRQSATGVVMAPRVAPLHAPAAPGLRDEPEEHTTLGLGPGVVPVAVEPEDDGDRPSVVELKRQEQLLALVAARDNTIAAREAEVTRLREQLFHAATHVVAAPVPAAKESSVPDRKAFLTLLYSLGGALLLLMGAATAWLGQHTAKVESKVDRTEQLRVQEKTVTDPLPAKINDAVKETVDCREWARLYSDYDRQIFRKLGVKIPEPPNSKPVEPIKTSARVRRPNQVNDGIILEVITLPPPLP